MNIEEVKSELCYYDLRNPNGIASYETDPDIIGELGNHAQKDCPCDNCFYGRSRLAEYILTLSNQQHE